jgi:hypothetical protein
MCGMPKTAGAASPHTSQASVYLALAEVNLHFDAICEHIERLQPLAALRGKAGRAFVPAFRDSIAEARAWFNTELLEAQVEIESREWARLDLLRARREKSFRDDRSQRGQPTPGASAKTKRRRM